MEVVILAEAADSVGEAKAEAGWEAAARVVATTEAGVSRERAAVTEAAKASQQGQRAEEASRAAEEEEA
jgi:hypothetical protein